VYVSPFNFDNANANNVSEDSLDRARRMIDLDPSHARRSFATAGELTTGRSGRSADDTVRQATVEPARPSLASQTPPAMTVEALERRRGLSQSQSQQVGAFQRSDEQRKSSRKRERERERDVGTQLSLGFASRKSPRLEDRVPTEDQPGSVATARRILQSLDGLETASASAAQSKQRFEGANGAKVAPPPNQSSLGSVALRQDALTPAHEGQQKPQHRPRSTHVSEQPQTPTTGDESNRRKEKPKSPPPTFDFSGEAEVPIDWHRPSRTKSEQGRKEHQQEEVDNQDSQQHLQPFTNHASATQTPTAEKTDTVVVRFRSPSSKDEQATQKRRENAKAASVVTRPLFIFGSKDQRRAQFARVKLEHHQRKQQHKQERGKQQQAEEHPQRKGSEQTTNTMEAPQEQQQQEQQQSPPANSWDPALLAQTKQHMDEVKSSVQQESGGGGSENKEQQQAANLASGATPAFHFGFRGEERKNGTLQATTSSEGAAASEISRTSQEAPSSFGTRNSLERGTSAFNFQPLSAQGAYALSCVLKHEILSDVIVVIVWNKLCQIQEAQAAAPSSLALEIKRKHKRAHLKFLKVNHDRVSSTQIKWVKVCGYTLSQACQAHRSEQALDRKQLQTHPLKSSMTALLGSVHQRQLRLASRRSDSHSTMTVVLLLVACRQHHQHFSAAKMSQASNPAQHLVGRAQHLDNQARLVAIVHRRVTSVA
jgi:hypothetical protein